MDKGGPIHPQHVAKPPGKNVTKKQSTCKYVQVQVLQLVFFRFKNFLQSCEKTSAHSKPCLLVEMRNVLLPLQLFCHLDPTCTENTDIVIYNQQNV